MPLERDIQVLSLANKLQDDSNQLTFKGLIAASVVGIGTIVALIVNVGFSRKEVNLLESQVKVELRPWLSLTAENAITVNSDLFQIQYENYGKTIAMDVIITSLIQQGKMTKKDIIANGMSYPEFDVSPKEVFTHLLPIPNNLQEIVNSAKDIQIGVFIKYKFGKNQLGESILIARWNPTLKKAYYKIKKLS